MKTPLFKSHYSIGKSILTLDAEHDDKGPDSALCLAKEAGLKNIILVEDSIGGFMEAYKNAQELELKLIFGWRVSCVNDAKQEDNDSAHKVIIFARNTEGYHELVKVCTKASTDLKFKFPRVDFEYLHSVWSDNLVLMYPFYDSFVYNNLFTTKQCIPDFSLNPVMSLEDNGLLFDQALRDQVKQISKSENLETEECQSVFYAKYDDFDAWVAFKCLSGRSFRGQASLSYPLLDFCSSNTFCLEHVLKNDD